MSRYITSLTLPDKDSFLLTVIAESKKDYPEWSFVRMPFFQNEVDGYPIGLFPKGLSLEFSPVTILYGNNGSGKSTILNLMAEILEIGRRSPINNSRYFSLFAKFCQLTTHSDFDDIDRRRDIITSDDVFKHCFEVRDSNRESLMRQNEVVQEKINVQRNGVVPLRGLEDFGRWKREVSLQRKSFSENMRRYSSHLLKPASNGETALKFFTSTINSAGVYLLDEPENSLSPAFQLKLQEFLQQTAEWMNIQYIIATHSPLLLGMPKAKIINLDEEGAPKRKWSELENIRILHDFFAEREAEFK
ncbi:MAG: AAA family ATPase [Victivallales bacterium]|nr:AAA family ATPase [Victivallales bacterium]